MRNMGVELKMKVNIYWILEVKAIDDLKYFPFKYGHFTLEYVLGHQKSIVGHSSRLVHLP
jgi:hypothetical protein